MTYRSNNILAFITSDENGKKILKQSVFFQQSLGMRLFILNIIEKPSLFESIFSSKRITEYKKEALNRQHEFVREIYGADIPKRLVSRVKSGNTFNVLLSQSRKGGYEFMIIDKSEAPDGLSRYETDKIISRSYCPVLAIHKDYYINEIKRIIIPVDISQATRKKLLWATYFAKKFGARITIVSALNRNISSRKSLARKNAERLKYMLYERGVDCDVKILNTGDKEKYEVILDFIENENADLIIIRTHQESNMSGTQIGNFVSEIVHGSTIPVFTVNRFLYPMPVDFEI